ncbi:MAG: mannose-1-phosphate guanylyltransferase [Flavobacteriales bacterium]|jgi:mannose-1-phosphate guanylyltransferase|nr:mannose-1-phosphate guanylyltransferase [Flavobacteriales bacterium]
MNNPHTYCIIMAGGIGSRFWPMSRTAHPKQFLDFLGHGRTLIQQTFDRFAALCPPENIYVVTNAQYAALVHGQLPALRPEQVLLEPDRRNTAPCIAYANHAIAKRDPKALIITAPSDHLVTDEKEFQARMHIALEQAAAEDCLVTLGITPDRPDTGYGYIQFSAQGPAGRPEVKRVKNFTEKPDHAKAQQFLDSGEYLWNSGIFIWSLTSIRKAFGKHLPEMEALFSTGEAAYGTPAEADFIAKVYGTCESISIDYGILEKADNVYVVAGDFGWSDLGTWGSLYAQLPKDANANAGTSRTVRVYDGRNNMVHVQDDRLVVLQGLEDFIVVSTPDALLVCRKHDEQKIKGIVQELTRDLGDKFI